MCSDIEVDYLPDLKPGKELQATGREPLHTLMEKADGTDQHRLAAQSTPPANSWSLAAPAFGVLSELEFRWALRRSLGVPFRSATCRSPDWVKEAGTLGTRAVCCRRSGQITRTHTALRDVVARIFHEKDTLSPMKHPFLGHPSAQKIFWSTRGRAGRSLWTSRSSLQRLPPLHGDL